jgi:hypothetical protein
MKSNSLQLGILRLRRSWTRWSRKRAARRLARERRRLLLLQALLTEQVERLRELERRQHPLLTVPVPVPQMLELPQPTPPPPMRARPEPTPPPEPENDPVGEIAQLLGLPQQQT